MSRSEYPRGLEIINIFRKPASPAFTKPKIGQGAVRKLVWLPMVAAIASGCAVSSDAPGQKVTGVYAYEVGSGSEPKPSSIRQEPKQSEPEAVDRSEERRVGKGGR